MFNGQDISEIGGPESAETDWNTMFGEANTVVTCGAWNFQGDSAIYGHEAEVNGKDTELDGSIHHFGGALFWRESGMGAFGLSGSLINKDVEIVSVDLLRGGVFGEFYVNDQFTLGGSAHWVRMDDLAGEPISSDALELAVVAKFYAMPELSVMARADWMGGDFDFGGDSESYDGYAITGEAEYLVWDKGASVFAGARYADREFFDDFAIEDMQVYAGIKYSFGGNTSSLVERDRSGAYDNTSVMHEKLPDWLSSIIAADP